jgi:hypothetical protein
MRCLSTEVMGGSRRYAVHALCLASGFLLVSVVSGCATESRGLQTASDGDSRVVQNPLIGGGNANAHPDAPGQKPLVGGDATNSKTHASAETPLMLAVLEGDTRAVASLLEKGADVNLRGATGETPLTQASFLGRMEVVLLLLEKGANVNARNATGATALMRAAGRGHTEIVRLLLERGGAVDAKDIYGGTSLMRASLSGRTEVVRVLLGRGADVHATDVTGETALTKASSLGRTEVVRLLLGKGAKESTSAVPSTPTASHPPSSPSLSRSSGYRYGSGGEFSSSDDGPERHGAVYDQVERRWLTEEEAQSLGILP